MTNHLNLRKFLTTKTLSRREARWWEVLSGLDLVIEYCEGKNNPADEPSRRPDYMDKDDKPFYIVSYVTRSSSKCKLAQAALREEGQTPKSPEENTGSDTSESLPGNSLQVSHKSHVDSGTSPGLGSDVPVIHAPEAEKKASRKRKRGVRDSGAAKGRSKKIRTKEKLPEGLSKPTRLYLLKDNGLLARASRQEIQAISARESVFGSPSLELRTILKIL